MLSTFTQTEKNMVGGREEKVWKVFINPEN